MKQLGIDIEMQVDLTMNTDPGSPYDRGTCDSYYGRGQRPHYYGGEQGGLYGGTVKFEFGDGKTTCKDGSRTPYCGYNKEYLPRHFLVVGDEGRPNGYRLEPEFSKVVCNACNSARQHKAERIKFRYAGNLTFTVNEDTGTCERNLEILVMPSAGYWGGPSHCSV